MPLRVSQMAEGTGVDPAQLVKVLESIAAEAMVTAGRMEADAYFYEIPAAISRIDTALMAVKSGLSVMVMTCLRDGVDFIAQDTREVPKTNDRSTGEDPVDGAGFPTGEVVGGTGGIAAGDGDPPRGLDVPGLPA